MHLHVCWRIHVWDPIFANNETYNETLLNRGDCRVVCTLSELGVSNEVIAKAFSVSGRTIKPDVSGKTSARRPCGGRKRMTLKPTNEH